MKIITIQNGRDLDRSVDYCPMFKEPVMLQMCYGCNHCDPIEQDEDAFPKRKNGYTFECYYPMCHPDNIFAGKED